MDWQVPMISLGRKAGGGLCLDLRGEQTDREKRAGDGDGLKILLCLDVCVYAAARVRAERRARARPEDPGKRRQEGRGRLPDEPFENG